MCIRDRHAALNGFTGFSVDYIDSTLFAVAIGGFVGFALGLALDSKFRTEKQRTAIAAWLWTMLVVGAILFMFLYPALQRVR